MLKTIAVIVCNNGLGHIRRVLRIFKELNEACQSKVVFKVFSDFKKLELFEKDIEEIKEFGRVFFSNCDAEVCSYEQAFMSKYKKDLKEADFVWSDNLLFPLRHHERVFLTGSFLWLDVISKDGFGTAEKEILRQFRPIMIGSKYFSTPNVKDLTDFAGVGIYDYFCVNIAQQKTKNVLLSCGKSKGGIDYFEKSLSGLKKVIGSLNKDVTVFVEPDYCSALAVDDRVKKADFSEEMFASVSAAVIRPGMGTMSDVLVKGGRIFSFCEDENFEVKHNANVIEELGVGKKCCDIKEALNEAAQYVENEGLKEEHFNRLKDLDFGGINQTIEKIKENVGII